MAGSSRGRVLERGSGSTDRRTLPAIAVVVGLAVLTAGCGGSGGSGSVGSRSTKAQLVAYARCMRRHGVSDFPDPTTLAGGGFAFQIDAGPGSDLNHDAPAFKSANQGCHAL